MRALVGCVALLAVLPAPAAAQIPAAEPELFRASDAATKRARAELAADDDARLWDAIHDSLQWLISHDPVKQIHGGQHLLALVTDEEAPPTAAFRLRLAKRLGELPFGGDGAAAYPVARWLFDHAENGEERANAAWALSSIETDAVDAFFRAVIDTGHTTRWVLRYAIDRAAAKKLRVKPAALLKLCHHYDEGVRTPAAEYAKSLGMPVPAELSWNVFDSPLGSAIRTAAKLLPDGAAQAKWVRFTARLQGGEPTTGFARLLEVNPPTLLLPDGRYLEGHWAHPAMAVAQPRDVEWTETTLAAVIDAYVADRQRFLETDDVHERFHLLEKYGIQRTVLGSEGRWPGGPADLLLAAAALEADDAMAAYRVIKDAFWDSYDPADLAAELLHPLAREIDQQMFNAFAVDPDAAQALSAKLAKADLFGYPMQWRAIELHAQLTSDRARLELPTAEEWARRLESGSKGEHLAFLMARIPAMHCFASWGFAPGSVLSFDQPQWALDGTLRINPVAAIRRLDLSGREARALGPLFEDHDFVPTFDGLTFGDRTRQVFRVSDLAKYLCNTIAREALFEFDPTGDREPLDGPGDRAAWLAWCDEHEDTRLSDALAADLANGSAWAEVVLAFWLLADLDQTRACRELVNTLDPDRDTEDRLGNVVALLACLGRTDYGDQARTWLAAGDDIGFHAATLLLLAEPDSRRALSLIRTGLARSADPNRVAVAIDALLASPQPDAEALVRELIGPDAMDRYGLSFTFVQHLFLEGRPGAFAALDAAIRGDRTLREPRYAWTEPKVLDRFDLFTLLEQLWGLPPSDGSEETDVRAVRLQLALKADWDKVRAGAAPTMHRIPLERPWPDGPPPDAGWLK